MKLRQALAEAGARLATLPDLDAPTFEAEVLLRHSLNLSRAELYLRIPEELTAEQTVLFNRLIERRLKGEPTAYILGRREFYGLDFRVDPRVLIPRPETEMLVEESLKLVHRRPVRSIADIGTGSGAIIVSLAVSLTDGGTSAGGARRRRVETTQRSPIKLSAVDISSDALELARLNARRQGVEERITFLPGDLIEPLTEMPDILVANLPYVTSAEVRAMPSAAFEPVGALDGGADGLDLIRRLAQQLSARFKPGMTVLLEIGMGQDPAVTACFQERFPSARLSVLADLAGINRVVIAEL